MLHHWKLKIIFMNIGLWVMAYSSFSQTPIADTVFVAYGQILVLKDTIITPGRDTLIILNQDQKYKVKKILSKVFQEVFFCSNIKIGIRGLGLVKVHCFFISAFSF